MPVKASLNEESAAARSAESGAASRNPELTDFDRQPVDHDGRADSDGVPSAAERLAAERTERRRQRAVAHAKPGSAGGRSRDPRREQTTTATGAGTERARLALRDSVSVTLIAVLVAGAGLGAILGSAGASGWVLGLLVAGLTVVLSAVLRSFSRPKR